MKQKIVVTQIVLVFLLSACSSTSQTDVSITESTLPNPTISKPVKDCEYLQDLAYELQNEAEDRPTRIAEDFIGQWSNVILRNPSCFTNEEYCAAIDAHNSVSPSGRQESSPYC